MRSPHGKYGLVDYEPNRELIDWVSNKIFDKNEYYWLTEGHVNGKLRFKMYCQKNPFEAFLEDIDNKHKIEVNYQSTGYKRAEFIIKSEIACGYASGSKIRKVENIVNKKDELLEIESKLKLIVEKI